MQSEDGECLSPEPSCDQPAGSESAGREDELDFEGDFAAGGEEDGAVRQADKDGEEGEDGEVAESGPSEGSDLEEGELKEDDDDAAAAPADVCKYYPRGSCTWGSECRFSHQSGECRPCRCPPNACLSAGQTGASRRHIPPLQPPTAVLGAFATRPPLLGLKPARPFFPVPPLLPAPSDPMASNWERGLRSAKERLAKAKERKESESDFDDKRLNMTVADETAAHRYAQSARNAYPGREPPAYSGRERRSPASEQRPSYHSSGSHHYASSYSQSRDYRQGHYSQQSHDESEYERRQRLAYQSAPRPEEWNDRPRPRPPAQYPLLDRYGREIQRCSRPDDYVDKWKRSPVRKVERPVRETGDLSSISTSDSPSGLSGTSDSDSDGSDWSDDEKDRKRVNHRTKKAAVPVVNPELQPASTSSTSGMKRIPRLSERQPVRSPKRPFKTDLPRPDAAFSSKDVSAGVSERCRSYRSSLSDSGGEAEFDDSKAEKRKGVAAQPYESKRRRDSHHSNGSPISRHSLSPGPSPGDSASPSPKREKERFVMDFVGKVTTCSMC